MRYQNHNYFLKNKPFYELPRNLWKALLLSEKIDSQLRWSDLSKYQKVNLLLSYNSYEEQKKLYDDYKSPENIVVAGCCFIIISAMIISSSSSSNSSDSGGFWRAFENFMNGFFND